MYFLALSQAPPVFDIEMAYWTPEIKAPGRIPAIALGPKHIPTAKGVTMTNKAGGIISLRDASI